MWGSKTTTVALIFLLSAGCAAQPRATPGATVREPSAPEMGPAQRYHALPHSMKVGLHVARSQLVEPVYRPVSYVARLARLIGTGATDASLEVVLRTLRLGASNGRSTTPVAGRAGMALDAWEDRLDSIVGTTRTFGRIELMIDGDEFFPALESAIAGARESVRMRTYIFDVDDVSLGLADLLKSRSSEIDVDIMFDGLGTRFAEQVVTINEPDLAKPASIASYLKSDSRIEVHDLSNPWLTGDHTKTTIVDEDVAFIGGMNIGREYRYDWHDVMVRVEGSIVRELTAGFDRKWEHSRPFGDLRMLARFLRNCFAANEPRDGYAIRVIRTRPYGSDLYRAQLAAIRNARSYIYIENAYFSDTAILHALVEARARGVDVRLITSLHGNHGIMNRANVIAVNVLLRAGVRVYDYRGMSHVKAAVYDGWAVVGSANFDRLSFRVNEELSLSSSALGFSVQVLTRIFLPDFEASDELTHELEDNWTHHVASLLATQL